MHANDPHRYDDMLELPHHVSKKHLPMPMENRAAQFSPFAALTGYDAVIQEAARLTDRRVELSDEEKLCISGKLQLILKNLREHPQVSVTFFQFDERKEGGAYTVVRGRVKKVDAYDRSIRMMDDTRIPIDDVTDIDGELFWQADSYPE